MNDDQNGVDSLDTTKAKGIRLTSTQPTDEELDPRVRLTNGTSGTTESVPRSAVKGLDEWVANWPQNPELPSRMTFGGWQGTDESHPPDGGRSGYRVVFKSVRTVVFPAVRVDLSNVRINAYHGTVEWGETNYPSAIPGRRSGEWIVPEWSNVVSRGSGFSWLRETPASVAITPAVHTTPPATCVEIIYAFDERPSGGHEELLAAGRFAVSSLVASLDLLFGERLIGPRITEEVGEVYDDWHWARRAGGGTVALEAQARFRQLKGEDLLEALTAAVDLHMSRGDMARQRGRIASQWYWRADGEAEPISKFLYYWLCVEGLLLEENSDIKPVKVAVARISKEPTEAVGRFIGRLYSTRNKVAHGSLGQVPSDLVKDAQVLATVLLEENLLGATSSERRDQLRNVISGFHPTS